MAAEISISQERIEKAILLIRGHKVILDEDLAALYGVLTRRLNEQVKRNRERFPEDFMFQLSFQEFTNFEVAYCDFKNVGWSSKVAVCLYRAWRCHGGECAQQSHSRSRQH